MTPDETIVHAMIAEMARLAPCEFAFRPHSLLMLVGLVQLATRHPNLTDANREFAIAFIQQARSYFADCPTVLDVIRKGDDPAQDVIVAPSSRQVQ